MDRPRAAATLAGGATVILWASAFVGIRSAGHHFAGGPLALGRLLVASVTLAAGFLISRSRRAGRGRREGLSPPQRPPGPRRPPRRGAVAVASRRDAAAVAACGLLWFGAYNVVLNEAERRVDAGTAAMLVNVGPILIALLAGAVLREGFPANLFRGLAVAFAGAIVIGLATRSRGPTATFGAVLCLAAAVCYAAGVVAQKPVLTRHTALAVTLAACLVGTVVCLPFLPGLIDEVGRAPAGAIAWMAYLGAFPTAVAFTTWAFALSRTTAGRMGALTYLVPPLAVLLGWVLLGETPAVAALGGGVLCLAGVALTRRAAPVAAALAAPAD